MVVNSEMMSSLYCRTPTVYSDIQLVWELHPCCLQQLSPALFPSPISQLFCPLCKCSSAIATDYVNHLIHCLQSICM